MKQRTRRRMPRHCNFGFVPAWAYRHRSWMGGAGRANFILAHWHRIATLDPSRRIAAEIGWWEGFRFIESPLLP